MRLDRRIYDAAKVRILSDKYPPIGVVVCGAEYSTAGNIEGASLSGPWVVCEGGDHESRCLAVLKELDKARRLAK